MDELDPIRLAVAAHELGHTLAWEHAGFTIRSTTVSGHGLSTEGTVRLRSDGRLHNSREVHGFLVGLLAGHEAERIWCDQTGSTLIEQGSAEDLTNFRRIHRHPWAQHLTVLELRKEARHIVRAKWSQIVRLAPRLAQRGRITT